MRIMDTLIENLSSAVTNHEDALEDVVRLLLLERNYTDDINRASDLADHETATALQATRNKVRTQMTQAESDVRECKEIILEWVGVVWLANDDD